MVYKLFYAKIYKVYLLLTEMKIGVKVLSLILVSIMFVSLVYAVGSSTGGSYGSSRLKNASDINKDSTPETARRDFIRLCKKYLTAAGFFFIFIFVFFFLSILAI